MGLVCRLKNRKTNFFIPKKNKKMLVARHRADLFQNVYREFSNNCLWVDLGRGYRESIYFKEAVFYLIFSLCELNPTNKVGCVVHEFLKLPFFEKPGHRRGVYKQIRYVVLPVLWKDHRAIERKKQEKLTFLANELSNTGRHVEGHIVRTIVKPYIRDLNRKWSKMTAVDKLKKVPPLLTR